MGTWGTTISSDDTYLDIYGEFFKLYNKGNEVNDITKYLIESNQEYIKDPESHDSNCFWFALANAQWECKKLQSDIFLRVKTIIENDHDLHFWSDLDKLKRKNALNTFLEKISSERPKPKPRTKAKPPLFQKGDCVTFKLSNGNFGGAVILEAYITEDELSLNLAAATRINLQEKPVLEDFINSEVLIVNFQFENDKQAFQKIDWLFPFGKKKVKQLTEVIGRIEVNYTYLINKHYGGMSRLDTWFESVIEDVPLQYKSEETKPKYKDIKTIKELTESSKWKFW